MNKKTAYIISFLLISGTVGLLFWLKKKEKKETDPDQSGGTGTVTGTGNTSSTTVSPFPLKQGSKGEKVKELQRLLNQYIDMYKFPMLYLILEQQQVENLVVDGIFGPKTLKALQFYFRSTAKTQITQDEFNLLKIKVAQ